MTDSAPGMTRLLFATRQFADLASEVRARHGPGCPPRGTRPGIPGLGRPRTVDELVSTGSPAEIQRLLDRRRRLVQRGVHVRAVHNPYGLIDSAARLLTSSPDHSSLRLGPVTVDLAIYDEQTIGIPGLCADKTLMVKHPKLAAAARALFAIAWEVAISPREAVEHDPRPWLTERQHAILGLLTWVRRDDEIAAQLGVSVRTIRADIAAIQQLFGTRGRFATGLRLGMLEAALTLRVA